MKDLSKLADQIEVLKGPNLELDVLAEIALFEPDEHFVSIRANNAGTKVIYTTHEGKERTCWPFDRTRTPYRAHTVAALRARATA